MQAEGRGFEPQSRSLAGRRGGRYLAGARGLPGRSLSLAGLVTVPGRTLGRALSVRARGEAVRRPASVTAQQCKAVITRIARRVPRAPRHAQQAVIFIATRWG